MITKNKNIVGRRVHDTYFLIDITDNYSDDKCALYEVSGMGEFIWIQLDTLDSVDAVVEAITASITDYIDHSIIHDDVVEFISVLRSIGFLEDDDGRD